MPLRGQSLTKRFNDLKRNNPGMSDEEAMKKAMNATVESRKKIRASDKKTMKKPSWIEKLKMGATKHIAEKYHSPAGRKHLQRKKAGL